jgi:hypothetical protein
MFKVKFFIALLALVGTASFPVSSYAGSALGREVLADAADAMTDIGIGMVEDAMMAPPSVPMMLRQSPAGSLPLRAEVETSHGYAPYH